MSNETAIRPDDVAYIQIPPDAWEAIGQLFASLDHGPEFLPHPDAATAIGAVNPATGELLGVLMFQLTWHMEPFVLSPAVQGKGIVSVGKMVAAMNELLAVTGNSGVRYYLQVANEPRALAAAAKAGLTPHRELMLHSGVVPPASEFIPPDAETGGSKP